MLAFLIKILEFAKPYRAQLFLGVFVGIISGLVAPLMIATIVFVYNVIFPPVVAPGPPSKEPVWMPAAIQDWLRNVQESLNHGLHTHPGAVVALVALIPGRDFIERPAALLEYVFPPMGGHPRRHRFASL
jgi:hypothetical protein